MPRVWFSLKRSLHCKTETSDVHVPKSTNHLSAISTRQPGRRSGCSRSIANLKDVINGGNSRRHFDKPPSCSPRSIGSSEFLNPITHEVILSDSTCELKISGGGDGRSAFLGTLRPGTPSSFRNSASSTPRKSSSPFLVSDSGGGFVTSRRFSIEVDSNGCSSASCRKCGEKLSKWEDAESHHLAKHAVTELVEGDSSRKVVEIICRTSWLKPEKNKQQLDCSRIMDKILKVHNTQKTVARFEEYRERVKMRVSKLQKKHPRCLADGNELLRFYATTLSCSLGFNTNSPCVSESCCVCRIIRNGFSVKEEVKSGNGIGIFTASTSGRALESVEDDDDEGGGGGNEEGSDQKKKKALIVCRVIAGRVHRPLENVKDMVGLQSGFDSLAGKLGVYSNIEELYVLNPSSLLPCFVVICKP
ncbi:uncharacterized protein LOC114762381 [Neltuma alba]|uniref:uncharacterized protein LOC114762381 n=1 Tax=Neltuma alba TaxID=207710 RepID=UPI0010A48F81|nr:uncharacterized protein LOC114762381 [Prosopis alba]